ncbi:unnamed protein product [Durusdinium trenchii]|uniref:Ribosomal eL28/Mak16 domain-containing protein n=1 Tax=Durusdinium trenchii TaxID=1381693 RepID=A0ABP0QNM5_9DINO
MAAPDLLWQCVKNQSCFIRKQKNFPVMTAEPGNLCGLNNFQFSGLASKKVLGLDSKKVGKKESIVLTTRSKRESRQYRPGVVLVTTGIKKGKKQGPEQLKKMGHERRSGFEYDSSLERRGTDPSSWRWP